MMMKWLSGCLGAVHFNSKPSPETCGSLISKNFNFLPAPSFTEHDANNFHPACVNTCILFSPTKIPEQTEKEKECEKGKQRRGGGGDVEAMDGCGGQRWEKAVQDSIEAQSCGRKEGMELNGLGEWGCHDPDFISYSVS